MNRSHCAWTVKWKEQGRSFMRDFMYVSDAREFAAKMRKLHGGNPEVLELVTVLPKSSATRRMRAS